MTRILLVDDHEVVRIGIVALLHRRPDYKVVAEAATAREAVDLAADLRPDLVIMDIRLPDGSGIAACREIRAANHGTRVIMLTSYADDEALFGSLLAGAEGYILKLIGSEGLIRAVDTVVQGKPLVDLETQRRLLEFLRARNDSRSGEELTPQEKRILQYIAVGNTNKEIAGELFLSEKTVRNHVSSILGKLGLSNRTQAAAYALRNQTEKLSFPI